jgi:hypothetical protein
MNSKLDQSIIKNTSNILSTSQIKEINKKNNASDNFNEINEENNEYLNSENNNCNKEENNFVNNYNNIDISESFLNDSDDENNAVLKEIIKTAKMREIEENKKLKTKNVKIEIINNVEILYNEKDKVTNLEVIDWNNNIKKKFKERDLSNYKEILQNKKKQKSILKNYNKDEILIDKDYVLDIDDLIEESIIYENENENNENENSISENEDTE